MISEGCIYVLVPSHGIGNGGDDDNLIDMYV